MTTVSTLPVFSWFPDVGSAQDCTPSVNSTKFGDGYEARTPQGINFLPQKWTMTFERAPVESTAILAFLRQQGGYLAFQWTTPLSELGSYVCKKWKTTQQGGTMKVSCEFDQVFEY